MRMRYSDIFPSLFLQDEKETEHVLVLRVQAPLWGSPGVNSVCTHLLFFLMKRISMCSHEPAWPKPTLELLYIYNKSGHRTPVRVLIIVPSTDTSSKKSILTCMVR